MKPFDNHEISPCRRVSASSFSFPNGHVSFEPCQPHEADVWTLYGHIPGEGALAIGDFATREDAEEVFQRITGIPFGSHEEVQARLRVMHAGEKLLHALASLLDAMGRLPVTILNGPMYEALSEASQAAEAAGRAA